MRHDSSTKRTLTSGWRDLGGGAAGRKGAQLGPSASAARHGRTGGKTTKNLSAVRGNLHKNANNVLLARGGEKRLGTAEEWLRLEQGGKYGYEEDRQREKFCAAC